MKSAKKTTVIGIILLSLIFGLIFLILNFEGLQSDGAHSISTGPILHQAKSYKQRVQPTYDMGNVKPISLSVLAHAWRCQRDYRAVGQIAIPQVGILLNIYRGCGNDVLALGAGTMRADQKMGQGNYPLAGHNMDDGSSYFSPLYTAKTNGTLKTGTRIFLTDFKKVYYYEEDSSNFINVYNLRLTYNTKEFVKHPIISLFTCDWNGSGRLFVKGHLTGYQSIRSASAFVKSIFKT